MSRKQLQAVHAVLAAMVVGSVSAQGISADDVNLPPSVQCNLEQVVRETAAPALARQCGLEGRVRIRGDLTSEGVMRNAHIVTSSHRVFNRTALDAATKVRCQPLEAAAPLEFTLSFRLDDGERKDPRLAADCAQPKAPPPTAPGS